MEKVLKTRDDVVFFVKLFPLKIHPKAYDKAKTIVCEKSLKLLMDAFDGKELPKPSCETTAIDENIKLAEELGITSTPTMVLPNGAVMTGYKDAEALNQIINKLGKK